MNTRVGRCIHTFPMITRGGSVAISLVHLYAPPKIKTRKRRYTLYISRQCCLLNQYTFLISSSEVCTILQITVFLHRNSLVPTYTKELKKSPTFPQS